MDDAEDQSGAAATKPATLSAEGFARPRFSPKQFNPRHLVENRWAGLGIMIPAIRQRRLAPEQQWPRQHDNQQDGQCDSRIRMHVVLLAPAATAPPSRRNCGRSVADRESGPCEPDHS